MKPSPDLEMSIPSTVGQNGHEMPPNYGRIYDPEGALPTESWHLPSASATMWSLGTVATDLQHIPKGVQCGDQG